MKALSIKRPWAWLIVKGVKDVENRTWPLPKTLVFPQRIYVHAGLKPDRLSRLETYRIIEKLPRSALTELKGAGGFSNLPCGAIVGEVDIVGMGESHSKWAVEGQSGIRWYQSSTQDALSTGAPI